MQKGNTKLIVLGVVLLGLAVAGYFLFQKSQNQTETPNTQSGSEINDKMMVEEQDVMTLIMGSENSLRGQLEDVSGGNGSGAANLLRNTGALYHFVEADLPEPADGSVYEGWLVTNTPDLKYFSTGVMKQSNGTYTLLYFTDNEYQGYDNVVITLETKVDATPEKHILEGMVE